MCKAYDTALPTDQLQKSKTRSLLTTNKATFKSTSTTHTHARTHNQRGTHISFAIDDRINISAGHRVAFEEEHQRILQAAQETNLKRRQEGRLCRQSKSNAAR